VLNKADVPEARELAELVRPDLEARGLEVHIVSAVAHLGLKELILLARPPCDQARPSSVEASSGHASLRPKAG
jgi:GTP-binding protein